MRNWYIIEVEDTSHVIHIDYVRVKDLLDSSTKKIGDISVTFADGYGKTKVISIPKSSSFYEDIIKACDEKFGVDKYTGVHKDYLIWEDDFNYELCKHVVEWKVIKESHNSIVPSTRFYKDNPFYLTDESGRHFLTLGKAVMKYKNWYTLEDNNIIVFYRKGYKLKVILDCSLNVFLTKYKILRGVAQ
jgi:hypothetical protein